MHKDKVLHQTPRAVPTHMRVRISHKDKRAGFLFVARQVEVTVEAEFSNAERMIIAERQLEDTIVLERFPDRRTQAALDQDEDFERWAASFHLRIRDLLRGRDRFRLDDPHAAKAYEARLSEALAELKTFIDGNARIAPSSHWEL